MRVADDYTYFVGSPLWGFAVWAHNTCTPEVLAGLILTAESVGPGLLGDL